MRWGIFLSVAGIVAGVVSAAPAQIRPFNYTFKNKYAEVDFHGRRKRQPCRRWSGGSAPTWRKR